MATVFFNARPFEVPIESDGRVPADVIRRMAGIPSNRALILKKPDGSNILAGPGQRMDVRPGDYVQEAPLHTRGDGR